MMRHALTLVLLLYSFNLLAQDATLMLPLGHTDWVKDGIFSPDNKKVVTVSSDNTAKIWDAATGLLVADLDIRGNALRLKITPANELMIVTSDNVTTWDLKTATLLRKITLSDDMSVNTASFSPDGKWLAIGTTFAAYIYDVATGEIEKKLTGHEEDVTICSFSPDGKRLITAGEMDYHSSVWDCDTWKELFRLEDYTGLLTVAEYTPDGNYIVTNDKDNLVFRNTETGRTEFTLPAKGGVYKIVFKAPRNAVAIMGTERLYEYDYKKKTLNFSQPLADNKPFLNYDATGKRLVYNKNDSLVIYNTENRRVERYVPAHNAYLSQVVFNGEGTVVLSTSLDHTAALWDVASGKLVHRLKGRSGHLESAVAFSETDFISSSTDSIIRYWNMKEGTVKSSKKLPISSLLLTATGNKGITTDPSYPFLLCYINKGSYYKLEGTELRALLHDPVELSNKGNFAATYSLTSDTISIWEMDYAKKVYQLQHRHIKNCRFSPNDEQLVSIAWNDTILKIWDITSGKLSHNVNNSTRFIAAGFTGNGKKIAAITENSVLKFYNVDGTLSDSFAFNDTNADNIIFNKGSNRFITTSQYQSPRLYDGNTKKLVRELTEQVNEVTRTFFSDDPDFFYTTSKDNSLKKWNAQTGQLIASFYGLDSLDNLVMTPGGYYKATPEAARSLYYITKDLKVITFDQLDLKYNRPDKVLRTLDNNDTALIKSYGLAYYKRMKKLGIDTTRFNDSYSVPEADIVNRNSIVHEQSADSISLNIKATDPLYNLERFNVWVNDVPLFGLKGISLAHRNRNRYDTTIAIRLSEGDNRIEAGVTNTNGIESYKMPLFVKNINKAKPGRFHFIGIGINKFADSANNLAWSVKDIRDLAKKLKTKYPGITIDTLFDKDVTKENVLFLKNKLLRLEEDDKVIISYSGHGLLSSNLDYYLSTYNIDFNKPEENGLSYDEMENLLDGIKPRKKLLLIDACHSGELDKDEISRIEARKRSLDSAGVKPKSNIKITGKSKMGVINSFELMQAIFVNVSRGTGTTIISAAGGMQYAQERGDLKNGVFTYSIIQAFNKNKSLTVTQLKKIVSENVVKLTKGLQKPTSRNETTNNDWIVW